MTVKPALALAAGLIAVGAALPASADDVVRIGPNGGTATTNWTTNGNTANGTVSLAGPNGGTGSGNIACAQGTYRQGCVHAWNYTNPAGETWSGGGAFGAGPYGAAKVGVVTGPNGGSRTVRKAWHR